MRSVLLIILFCSCSSLAFAQNIWTSFNDSCFEKTKSFYDSCRQLTSSKLISSDKIDIDRALIKFINQVYNDPTYSLAKLETQKGLFPNSGLSQNRKSGKTTVEFNANADGNLYVSVKAVLEGDVLKAKQIYLATKTHVLCNSDPMYVNGLDFLYLSVLTKEIVFPLALQPYQSNLEIVQSD